MIFLEPSGPLLCCRAFLLAENINQVVPFLIAANSNFCFSLSTPVSNSKERGFSVPEISLKISLRYALS